MRHVLKPISCVLFLIAATAFATGCSSHPKPGFFALAHDRDISPYPPQTPSQLATESERLAAYAPLPGTPQPWFASRNDHTKGVFAGFRSATREIVIQTHRDRINTNSNGDVDNIVRRRTRTRAIIELSR